MDKYGLVGNPISYPDHPTLVEVHGIGVSYNIVVKGR